MNRIKKTKPLGLGNNPAKPDSIYVGNGVNFFVYKAKNLLVKKWINSRLKKIVSECRKSYHRYGKREIFDKYDNKAAIYLACVRYPADVSGSKVIEEWLSVRFVPGQGTPLGANELEIYSLDGKNLDKVMKEKFFGGDRDFWKNIISSSRMCGIISSADGSVPVKHRYTAVCFSIIQRQFMDDCIKSEQTFKYLTEIVRNDFMKKALSIRSRGGDVIMPPSVPAYKFLNKKREEIILDRSIYADKFPAYWLDAGQLNGPELKITDFNTWNLGINKILSMAGINKQSFK